MTGRDKLFFIKAVQCYYGETHPLFYSFLRRMAQFPPPQYNYGQKTFLNRNIENFT